jgi:hypothetical protein
MLAGLCVLWAAGAVSANEPYTLREKAAVGDQWRTELAMRLTGQVFVRSGERVVTLELSATAHHQFPERITRVDAAGHPLAAARFYEQAKAEITAQGKTTVRTLRPDRRVQVAQRLKDETITYSPAGPLTREEAELTGDHLDVLMLGGLLPAEPVSLGAAWDVPVPTAQALAGLEGVIEHNLRGKLEKVEGDRATVRVAGTVSGIDSGAEVKTTVEGTLVFDLSAQRIIAVQWQPTEERSQGPVTPAARTTSVTTVTRTFGAKSDALSDGVAASLPAEPALPQLLLEYRDPQGRCVFLYDRAWHVAGQTDQFAVLRLLDRGELIAQLNVIPWTKAQPGRHLDPAELRQRVEQAPNFKLTEVLNAGEVPSAEAGRWVYRLAVAGESGDLRLLQNHYIVAGPQGDQVLLSFTTELAHADRFGGRDLPIVTTVTFPGPPQ